MIGNECFLCEKPVLCKNVCAAHYHQARRLTEKYTPIELAIDLLIYKIAFDEAEKRYYNEANRAAGEPPVLLREAVKMVAEAISDEAQ